MGSDVHPHCDADKCTNGERWQQLGKRLIDIYDVFSGSTHQSAHSPNRIADRSTNRPSSTMHMSVQ